MYVDPYSLNADNDLAFSLYGDSDVNYDIME